jgi:hypothetical protein
VEKIVSNPFEHVEKMRAEFSITPAEKKARLTVFCDFFQARVRVSKGHSN